MPRGRGLSRGGPLLIRLILELFCAKQHTLTHDFSRLELHGRARRDGNIDIGLVRVTSHAGAGEAHLEHSEIPQLDTITLGQSIRDMVESLLNDIEDIALDKTRFVADCDDKVAFGEVGHDEKGKKATVGVEFYLSGGQRRRKCPTEKIL